MKERGKEGRKKAGTNEDRQEEDQWMKGGLKKEQSKNGQNDKTRKGGKGGRKE